MAESTMPRKFCLASCQRLHQARSFLPHFPLVVYVHLLPWVLSLTRYRAHRAIRQPRCLGKLSSQELHQASGSLLTIVRMTFLSRYTSASAAPLLHQLQTNRSYSLTTKSREFCLAGYQQLHQVSVQTVSNCSVVVDC